MGILNENSRDFEKIAHQINNLKQMTPKQCAECYNAMMRVYPKHKDLRNFKKEVKKLCIKVFFKKFKSRRFPDRKLREYEYKIKDLFVKMTKRNFEFYKATVEEIRGKKFSKFQVFNESEENKEENMGMRDGVCSLIMKIKEKRKFPAILFLLSRRGCEMLARDLQEYLELHKKSLFSDREMKENRKELEEVCRYIQKNEIKMEKMYLKSLKCGIAVHHGGVGHIYKSEIERLFRLKKIKLIIATGTLALGIHLPCKTVVIYEDSVYLTSTLFSQMSGRSGRRGFDVSGSVIIYGINRERIRRLMTKGSEKVIGQLGITPTLTLRLFTLLSNSSYVKDVIRMLENPLSNIENMGRRSSKVEIVKHQFRFCVQFIMRFGLLDQCGSSINFAGLVSHLFYTEPSNFLFLHFLERGLCHKFGNKKLTRQTGENLGEFQLVKVLCFLFTDIVVSKKSHLKLGNIPLVFQDSLKEYEEIVTKEFKNFIFCHKDISKEKRQREVLPFSGVDCGKKTEPTKDLEKIVEFVKSHNVDVHILSLFKGLIGMVDEDILGEEYHLRDILSWLREDFYIDPVNIPLPFSILKVNSAVSSVFF